MPVFGFAWKIGVHDNEERILDVKAKNEKLALIKANNWAKVQGVFIGEKLGELKEG